MPPKAPEDSPARRSMFGGHQPPPPGKHSTSNIFATVKSPSPFAAAPPVPRVQPAQHTPSLFSQSKPSYTFDGAAALPETLFAAIALDFRIGAPSAAGHLSESSGRTLFGAAPAAPNPSSHLAPQPSALFGPGAFGQSTSLAGIGGGTFSGNGGFGENGGFSPLLQSTATLNPLKRTADFLGDSACKKLCMAILWPRSSGNYYGLASKLSTETVNFIVDNTAVGSGLFRWMVDDLAADFCAIRRDPDTMSESLARLPAVVRDAMLNNAFQAMMNGQRVQPVGMLFSRYFD